MNSQLFSEEESRLSAKFEKVCVQLQVLNRRVEDTIYRYNLVKKNNKRSSLYCLKIQLCVMENLKKNIYQYAERLADDLDQLRRRQGYIVVL